MSSLLNDLKAAAPTELDEHPWAAAKRTLPLLVPKLEILKMDVYADGRVAARGRAPMKGQGRYYWVFVLDPVGTGLPDGRRELRLGIAKYRDEADAMIYDRPFRVYIDPQPGAIVAWLVGVLTIEDPFSDRRDVG